MVGVSCMTECDRERKRVQIALSDINRLEQAFCMLRKRVYSEKMQRLQREEDMIREGK
jgi:hypothetical protein